MSIINKLKAVADIITPPAGYKTLFFRSDTGVPALKDENGSVVDLVIAGDASGVTYTPDNALYWTDSVDPGNVSEALDDLAVRLNVVENDNAVAPDASEVTYEPQTSLHWTDSEDPGNVDDALDDLAARVNAIEENPAAGGASDAADLTYTPANNANWNGSADPGDTADALDQLASRTKTLETAVVDAASVTFTPTNAIHWTDSEDPGNVDDALNDLASRTQALEETGGGGGNAFGTIAVSGQTDVVADQANDTLTFVAGTNITITTNESGDSVTIAAAGGSLTNWTEAVNTAAPNATVPVTSFTATNAATNVDAAIVPKGTGALLAHVPDSTSAGGNKRGASAVDLQHSRNAASQVASGTESTIAGGRRNTASNTYASVLGGNTNTASSTAATVCGGDSNTASATWTFIGGGAFNTVQTNGYGAILGGYSNTVSGSYAACLGGTTNSATGTSSQVGGDSSSDRGISSQAYATGRFSSAGDAQRRNFILRSDTTTATPEAVTTDNSTAATTNQIVLPNNSLYAFNGQLVVRENATGDSKAIEFKGAIKRGANAAATALLGSVTQADIGTPDAGATWTVAFTADTTNGCLKIEVTGEAAHNLKWAARVETVEVAG